MVVIVIIISEGITDDSVLAGEGLVTVLHLAGKLERTALERLNVALATLRVARKLTVVVTAPVEETLASAAVHDKIDVTFADSFVKATVILGGKRKLYLVHTHNHG